MVRSAVFGWRKGIGVDWRGRGGGEEGETEGRGRREGREREGRGRKNYIMEWY